MVKETIPDDWTIHWQDKSGETTICKRRVVNILDKYDFKGKKVLDAGSGTGYFSNIFLMKGAKVYSLDFSEKALELTGKNAKDTILVHGDVRKIPFPKNSFDYIFSDGLLEHFDNPKEILKEFKRVLKKNGIIITFVPNKFSYWLFAKPFIMPNIKEDSAEQIFLLVVRQAIYNAKYKRGQANTFRIDRYTYGQGFGNNRIWGHKCSSNSTFSRIFR